MRKSIRTTLKISIYSRLNVGNRSSHRLGKSAGCKPELNNSAGRSSGQVPNCKLVLSKLEQNKSLPVQSKMSLTQQMEQSKLALVQSKMSLTQQMEQSKLALEQNKLYLTLQMEQSKLAMTGRQGPIELEQSSVQEPKMIVLQNRLARRHENQTGRTKLKRQRQSMQVRMSSQKRVSFWSSLDRFPS